ncbi:LacI family transcriptional regulator [Rubritalea squalenifaciens DSM 18772]|uniref:LacI family transcriptional regulator n=2 Tax=Rubritalea TaxID=361050 RepID=A0A1M6B9P2_9BACT|nr:substrate-binding domain-containing protein [Rubritalea squalenifaciens]SHI45377.1 LacI family transcriptional regulator [Rubritalea squalenifaciens DSM 18772]
MKKVLVLTELRTHYGRQILSGLMMEARAHDWWNTMRLTASETDRDAIAQVLAQVDGVIVRDASPEVMEELKGQEVPTVVLRGAMGEPVEESETMKAAAHVDDASVGALAVEELKRLSVKHWGFVGFEGVGWSRGRGEALMNHPAVVHAIELRGNERESWSGVLRLAEWLRKVPKPIGVFGCSDSAGLTVLQACQYAGFSVPNQVAVIGVDNDVQLCHTSVPPLSSIDLHATGVGQRAAWQLANMLGLPTKAEPVISPARLVARESSHEVDRYFLCYQKAVEWLSSNALRGPSVDELSDVTGISRRGLERAFEKHAKVSPASVIREHRMKAIEILLARDSLTLDRIAAQAGFTDAAGLSNFVKRQTGKSPRELRETL